MIRLFQVQVQFFCVTSDDIESVEGASKQGDMDIVHTIVRTHGHRTYKRSDRWTQYIYQGSFCHVKVIADPFLAKKQGTYSLYAKL